MNPLGARVGQYQREAGALPAPSDAADRRCPGPPEGALRCRHHHSWAGPD